MATIRHPPVEIVEKMLACVMEIVNGVGENVYQKVCNWKVRQTSKWRDIYCAWIFQKSNKFFPLFSLKRPQMFAKFFMPYIYLRPYDFFCLTFQALRLFPECRVCSLKKDFTPWSWWRKSTNDDKKLRNVFSLPCHFFEVVLIVSSLISVQLRNSKDGGS